MKNIQLWFGSPLGLPALKRKMYFDPTPIIAGAAATTNAIIGGAASLYGSGSATADSRSARDYDSAKFNISRLWQLQDRDFALQNQREQMAWQEKQRLAEQAFIASQNNPRNQVAKLLSAGINPAAVFGQAGSGGQIGSAPSTPSAPGMPTLPQQVGTSAAGLTFSRSQAIASLGETIAKLTSAAAQSGNFMPEIRQSIAEANKAVAETSKENEQANWLRLQGVIANVKLPAEINKLIEDARSAHLKGDYDLSSSKLNDTLERLNSLDYEIKKETKDTLIAMVGAQLETEQERKKTEQAKQNESNAAARLSSATARTEDEKRQFVVQQAQALATIEDFKAKVQKGMDVTDAIRAAQTLLDRQYFEDENDLEEARRKLDYIRRVNVGRNDDKVFRLLDDFLQSVTRNINSAIVGAFK